MLVYFITTTIGFMASIFAVCRASCQIRVSRELQISVGTAGPQPRAPDHSGHCRTSTANGKAQSALPDFNRERQMSDRMPQRMSDRMSEYTSDRMPDRMSIMPEYVYIYIFHKTYMRLKNPAPHFLIQRNLIQCLDCSVFYLYIRHGSGIFQPRWMTPEGIFHSHPTIISFIPYNHPINVRSSSHWYPIQPL